MHARTHKSFANLREFYDYYLGEHGNRICRRLHFLGTSLSLLCAAGAIVFRLWWLALVGIGLAYGFAWIGHFFFERNSPATFRHPLRSFVCDFLMFGDMLRGRIPL